MFIQTEDKRLGKVTGNMSTPDPNSMQRVCICFTPKQIEKLKDLVKRQFFPNFSEAVRYCITTTLREFYEDKD